MSEVKDTNCAYCMKGELVAKFGYPICDMKSGYLYLFKEQSKKGRVILAHHKHVSELIELTDEERNEFFADIAAVSRALHKLYNPDKVNYGAYGDTGIRDITCISIWFPSMKAETNGAAYSR